MSERSELIPCNIICWYCSSKEHYRIAGKFGGELNLALWRIDQPTAKLKIRQYLIRIYTYVRKILSSMVKLIMGVVDLGQAHERELIHVIVDLSCFLTCMLGGVRFYYYLSCHCIDSSPKLACHRECHR